MHESTTSGTPTLSCDDLDEAIALHEHDHGWRLDMIMPADAPRVALLSRNGERLRLECRNVERAVVPDDAVRALAFARSHGDLPWSLGRAGMRYRDLIPGRLGGHAIASHIRIPDGGEVPDRVHYHDVRFQVIYCRRGWVRVAYEDQGPPLTMREGDCVLQPPFIRHRVLESSPGLEVIELACPAEHPTWIDHDLVLPKTRREPARSFSGQRFVHHITADAAWQPAGVAGVHVRDTGIATATAGLAGVRVLRLDSGIGLPSTSPVFETNSGALFLHVLDGTTIVEGNSVAPRQLGVDDACTIPAGFSATIRALGACELLAIATPA